jgi:hypothetical protein
MTTISGVENDRRRAEELPIAIHRYKPIHFLLPKYPIPQTSVIIGVGGGPPSKREFTFGLLYLWPPAILLPTPGSPSGG